MLQMKLEILQFLWQHVLAPLTDNPNASNKWGSTPVSIAVHYGYTDILNILAPLTNNPNAHDSD